MSIDLPMHEQPLPSSDELKHLHVLFDDDSRTAYGLLLDLQAQLSRSNEANNLSLQSVKILGFLLIHLWDSVSVLGSKPIARLSREVASAAEAGSEVVFQLGALYRDHLLYAFRSAPGRASTSSDRRSRPFFDSMQDLIKDTLMASSRDYNGVKEHALVRDNYRCLVTGKIDSDSAKKCIELRNLSLTSGRGYGHLELCHILNQLPIQDLSDSQDTALQDSLKRGHASGILVPMPEMVGLTDLVETMKKGSIHHLANVVTMSPEAHHNFAHMEIWFEATRMPNGDPTLNEYKICSNDPSWLLGLNIQPDTIVTFTVNFSISSIKNGPLPALPSPTLLALHATCCKVAHMSGAAEYFDEIDLSLERQSVLAEDGSSAVILLSAIQRAIPVVSSGHQ